MTWTIDPKYPIPQIVAEPPEVFVIGWSKFYPPGLSRYLRYRDTKFAEYSNGKESLDDPLMEIAGRVCYASLPNPRGATTFDYLQDSIVKHKHESVIEHATINFLIADLPRSVLMELARHRVGTAMSFESTRFTFENMRLIMPPLVRKGDKDAQCGWALRATQATHEFYRQLDELGYSPDLKRKQRKRIVEAARVLMPTAQGCDGVWTVNMRELRHVMLLRSSPDADLSFREFVAQLWEPAVDLFPSVFADLEKITDDEGYAQIVRRT